jgi:hypothetical protein
VFEFPLVGQMTASGKHRRGTPLQLPDDVRELAGFIGADLGGWFDTWLGAREALHGELFGHALAFMDCQSCVAMKGRRPAPRGR